MPFLARRALPARPPAGPARPSAVSARPSAVSAGLVRDVLRGPGQPLAAQLREDMESRLGADFSGVRVHADSAARASASDLGARAYTVGSHIVVGAGGTDKRTLAHELTHVIQQRTGPVAGTGTDGVRISDPADRFERQAEAHAARVMTGPAVHGDRAQPDSRTRGKPDQAPGAVRSRVPGLQPSLTVQRILIVEDEVDENDRAVISRVLAANPLLWAVWLWIRDHPRITFTVGRLENGSSNVTARLPLTALQAGLIGEDLSISLNLNVFTGAGDERHRKPVPHVLEMVSHELNLHLLPWARVMMFKEFRSLDTREKFDAYPAAQRHRIYTVLSYSGDLTTGPGRERLIRDIKGDAANKYMRELTGQGQGNHSDIGLWLLHLRTIAQLADGVPDPVAQAVMVSTALRQMILPMYVTGRPEHSIVRNDEVLDQCIAVLDGLLAVYGPRQQNQAAFAAMIENIKARLRVYAGVALAARQAGGVSPYTVPGMYERAGAQGQ